MTCWYFNTFLSSRKLKESWLLAIKTMCTSCLTSWQIWELGKSDEFKFYENIKSVWNDNMVACLSPKMEVLLILVRNN